MQCGAETFEQQQFEPVGIEGVNISNTSIQMRRAIHISLLADTESNTLIRHL